MTSEATRAARRERRREGLNRLMEIAPAEELVTPAEVGAALLRVIAEAQRTGCTGCCTAEYARDRQAVKAAIKNGDLPTLRQVAQAYGLTLNGAS